MSSAQPQIQTTLGDRPANRPTQGIAARLRNGVIGVFAVLGILFTLWFAVGTVEAIQVADETEGGYEYPYQGWTGKPIAFSTWYGTPTGMYSIGRVGGASLNCTTGTLTFNILGTFNIDFRPFSDRAKVVHQPQVECRKRGFDTSAWDAIDDPRGLYTELQTAGK